MCPIYVSVSNADFTPAQLIAYLGADNGAAGAVVTFTGVVRDSKADGGLVALCLEHYPGMTEKALQRIAEHAATRWSLLGVAIVHRVGELPVGANIVGVAVSAPHRAAAFEGASFIMDYLKTEAPFWKKEIGPHGSQWVEARASDDAARARWQR